MLDFWQWVGSDLANNTLRGKLAEYVVALALDVADGIREEWAEADILVKDGFSIEVKCSSYLQGWDQTELSKIRFDIAKKRKWNLDRKRWEGNPRRASDLYVFALIATTDRQQFNPLDLRQWRFFVIPTDLIDLNFQDQKTVAISRLQAMSSAVEFGRLGKAIDTALKRLSMPRTKMD